MFQVPMKMEIMSGSSCFECLFFMSCSSWQKASRFCGDSSQSGAGRQPGNPTLAQGHPAGSRYHKERVVPVWFTTIYSLLKHVTGT